MSEKIQGPDVISFPKTWSHIFIWPFTFYIKFCKKKWNYCYEIGWSWTFAFALNLLCPKKKEDQVLWTWFELLAAWVFDPDQTVSKNFDYDVVFKCIPGIDHPSIKLEYAAYTKLVKKWMFWFWCNLILKFRDHFTKVSWTSMENEASTLSVTLFSRLKEQHHSTVNYLQHKDRD